MEKNEAAAQETLNTLVRALYRYANNFPQTGFPASLRSLTLPLSTETAPYLARFHGLLLDESFAADPLIKAGYQFRYLLTGTGSGEPGVLGEFEITATPVEFGKTGTKNYFVNQDGRIRMTSQNRPAAADDAQSPED